MYVRYVTEFLDLYTPLKRSFTRPRSSQDSLSPQTVRLTIPYKAAKFKHRQEISNPTDNTVILLSVWFYLSLGAFYYV